MVEPLMASPVYTVRAVLWWAFEAEIPVTASVTDESTADLQELRSGRDADPLDIGAFEERHTTYCVVLS